MKIGVVTFFNNGNYGSELQAFAMNSILKKYGHEVCFCKFRTTNLFIKAIEKVLDRLEISLNKVFLKGYKEVYNQRTKNSMISKQASPDLFRIISQFSETNINSCYLSRKFYPVNRFDCWICGSDQIWSSLKMPFMPERFLTRVPSYKKIAYAVSLGQDTIPPYFSRLARRAIISYKYLSFREEGGRDYVKKCFGIDSTLVLDPTMLVSRESWLQEISCRLNENEKESYSVCYFLGEISEEYKAIIKKYNQGRKLVVLAYPQDADFLGGEYARVNPLEFVQLISNSCFVFTDSFHGTLFSILMNKEFLSFKRGHLPAVSQTKRVTGLLRQFDINGRYYDGSTMLSDSLENLDYNKINSLLQKRREESLQFLRDSLVGVSKDIQAN